MTIAGIDQIDLSDVEFWGLRFPSGLLSSFINGIKRLPCDFSG